jgi:hypothetical protein
MPRPTPSNGIDAPSMSCQQHRCSIDAVIGAGRARRQGAVSGFGRDRRYLLAEIAIHS